MLFKIRFFLGALALACCAATPSWAATYSSTVLADGPLAYWRLGDAASPAIDLTGNGHNGAVNGAVQFGQPSLLGSDTVNKSINVNGDRLVVPGFEKLVGGTGYTAEYWIKANALPGGCCTNLLGDGESGGDFFFMNYMLANGAIRPHFGTGNPTVAIDSNQLLQAGRTYYVATTWSSVTGVGSIYINGVLDKSAVVGTNLPAPGTTGDNQIFIGRDNREGGGNILMDEVAFYNKALTGAQISDPHYGAGGATSVSLSTSVLNQGNPAGTTYADNYNNNSTTSTVELVKFIPNPAIGNTAPPVQYTQAGATIDLSAYVVPGATAGTLGSNMHGRGSTLFFPGDGETAANNNGGIGIGAHANWLVTFDLNDIRTANLGGTTLPLSLTGRFGMNGNGNPGEVVQPGNFVEGLIFLDGNLIQATPLRSVTDPSFALNVPIPASGHFLTLAIVNQSAAGGGNTTFDDGAFRDLTLTAVPEPSSFVLAGAGLCGLALAYRRRRK